MGHGVRVLSLHMSTDDISAAVGLGMAEVRKVGRLRQQDVADAARAVGVPWTQATVAAVETGKRKLSTTELVLVAEIVHLATLTRVSLVDLIALGGTDELHLTGMVQVSPADLPRLLAAEHSYFEEMLEGYAMRRVLPWLRSKGGPREIADASKQLFGSGIAAEIARRLDAYGEPAVSHRVSLVSHLVRTVVHELRLFLLRAETGRGEHVYDPGDEEAG